MPTAFASKSLKIGAFTAVSTAFSAGIAAMALTYTAPEPPFGGAPVFEVQLLQDAGMSAPASQKGSTKPETEKVEPAPQPAPQPAQEAHTDEKASVSDNPSVVKLPAEAQVGLVSVQNQVAAASDLATSSSARPAVTSRSAGSPVSGDDRQGAATQGAQGGPRTDNYEAQVIRWLEAHKRHPGRLSGVVTLKFVVDRRGHLRDSVITRSSGDARLDRIALQQIREASPLPRPPHDVAWHTREITVSLDYRSCS